MLPFSTAFVAANGTLLPAFNAAFENVEDPIEIQGNAASPIGASGSCVAYADAGWLADQYSEMTVGIMSGDFIGVSVRCQAAGTGQFYAFLGTNSGSGLYRFNVGFVTLVAGGPAFSPGDIVRLEISGATLTGIINGVPVLTAGDATYGAGRGGLTGFPFGAPAMSRANSFRAGNILAPAVGAGAWPMGVF